jgi:hypothetical protein
VGRWTQVPSCAARSTRACARRGRIAEIEHILTTKRDLSGPSTPIGEVDQYWQDPNLAALVAPEKRISRERLIAHADGYFVTLANNDGEIRGTRFSADASRVQNGRKVPEIEKDFKTGYYRVLKS